MGDKLDMDQLSKREFAKRTRWLVLGEALVILALLAWVAAEYENNVFLRGWANENIGPLSFLLNGTLAGLYAGTLLGYLMAKYFGKRTEEEEILESLKKKSIK
jgi:hypothetical protein